MKKNKPSCGLHIFPEQNVYTVISQNWIFFVIIIKTHKNNNNISDKKLIKKSKQYYICKIQKQRRF